MGGYLNKLGTKGSKVFKISFLFVIFGSYFYKVYQVTSKAEATANAYDSPSYFKFELFPAFRMQLITIPYVLISDPEKIINFQTIISVVSWLLLALAIVHFFSYSLVSFSSLPFIFILATSSVVLEHNYILASESLNNSALVFLVAATLYYFKVQSNSALLFISMAFVMVAGTKSAAAMAILVVALSFYLVLLFIQRKVDLKSLTIMSIFTLFITFFAATALSSNITKTLTTSGTINNRIWVDENWRDQILKSGYPATARKIWETYSQKNLGSPPDQAVVDSPEFMQWWNSGGENFLNVFMLKNPSYTLVGPFCLPCLNENFKFEKTLVAGWGVGTSETWNYPSLSSIGLARTFFWPIKPEDSYFVIGLVSLAILTSLLFSIFSKGRPASALISCYTLLMSFVLSYSLISWWFGSKPVDMTRHQLGGALTLRILAIVSVVYIVGAVMQFAKSSFTKVMKNEK
jgi:hypothetical protein